MLLAVDIGNTNITLGVFDRDELLASWRLFTDVDKMAGVVDPELYRNRAG
jgi:type III pantothenate kinase